MSDVRFLRMAGPLRNGWERGKGAVYHAVPSEPARHLGKALCGRAPSIMWSSSEGEKATCPRCLKKLGVRFTEPDQRVS